MSQLDQAFLKAYAKDRGRHSPTNADSIQKSTVQPATLPTNLQSVSGSSKSVFAHSAESLAAPHVDLRSSETAYANQIALQNANRPATTRAEATIQTPKQSTANTTVNTSVNASRQQSSTTVRIDRVEQSTAPASDPNPSSLQTTRKTLNSYFQQSRVGSTTEPPAAIPTLATRWSKADKTSGSQQSTRPISTEEPDELGSGPQQNFNSPIDRGSEYNAFQFQVVERGIKSNSTSDGPAAKIRNPGKPGSFIRVDQSHGRSHESNPFTRPISPTIESPIQPLSTRSAPVAPEYVPSIMTSTMQTEPMALATGFNSATVKPAPPEASTYASDSKRTSFSSAQSKPPAKPLAENLAKLTVPVQPTWEVDEFLWPATIAGLMETQSEALRDIGLHLQHAASKGLRTLAITSGERGVGRSTVAMCVAKAVSKAGLRVALVDCDYECPSLVDQLNLDVAHGWQECILNNVPLDEVAVYAVNEKITFFPALAAWSNSQIETNQLRINKLLKRISLGYDLVVLDCNRINGKQQTLLGLGEESVIDAALVIVDAQLSLRQRVDGAIETLRRHNINSIGLAENFHSQG